ncbi:tumor necrosis factor receptor superfamily member 14-like [Hoplias malabaricus]|uniref:tumor necrosis factor receptor superfamily member 14-like n=1 Tax=Hoplias malabaricus TaxID=27720 RepID=UPI0034630CE6
MQYDPKFITWFTLCKLSLIMLCRACGSAEYRINEECCQMCSAGHRVYRHCSGDFSTTCVPCVKSTYTAFPNGQTSCLPCTICDEGSGLRIKQKCYPATDAICEPLPGHYCMEPDGQNCRKAMKHSSCLPGQYINQTGTAFTDTVCNDCAKGTYSNGSFTFCKICESMGKITVAVGTNSQDSECTERHVKIFTIISFSLFVLLLLGLTLRIFYVKKKQKNKKQWTVYILSGRPTKITPRGQQLLIQEFTKDSTTTSKELQASFASVKVNIHDSTIRKGLDKMACMAECQDGNHC